MNAAESPSIWSTYPVIHDVQSCQPQRFSGPPVTEKIVISSNPKPTLSQSPHARFIDFNKSIFESRFDISLPFVVVQQHNSLISSELWTFNLFHVCIEFTNIWLLQRCQIHYEIVAVLETYSKGCTIVQRKKCSWMLCASQFSLENKIYLI